MSEKEVKTEIEEFKVLTPEEELECAKACNCDDIEVYYSICITLGVQFREKCWKIIKHDIDEKFEFYDVDVWKMYGHEDKSKLSPYFHLCGHLNTIKLELKKTDGDVEEKEFFYFSRDRFINGEMRAVRSVLFDSEAFFYREIDTATTRSVLESVCSQTSVKEMKERCERFEEIIGGLLGNETINLDSLIEKDAEYFTKKLGLSKETEEKESKDE